ncbi:ribosomal protein S6 kinase delta-1 isoform X2 [Heterodontus francisci]|uniref:ribosomal protein S6 kinase delta-1 isoform X2 n=1 Tax=Heterodontus francisci TaxID=7792 RepID=UPI00355C352B
MRFQVQPVGDVCLRDDVCSCRSRRQSGGRGCARAKPELPPGSKKERARDIGTRTRGESADCRKRTITQPLSIGCFKKQSRGGPRGRFDETVIEERRQCAEDLLQFSANIPALYNSKQLEDFFKDGEVHDGSELIGPVDPSAESLIDNLSDGSTEARRDVTSIDDVTISSQSECGEHDQPGLSSDSDLLSLTVDTDSLTECDDGMASNRSSPSRYTRLNSSPEPTARSATFPHQERSKDGAEGSKGLWSQPIGSLKHRMGRGDYLTKAGEQIKLALQKEAEQDYEGAFKFYRNGVDMLLQGVQDEPSLSRREAVKRKTAEYLMRAEQISQCLRTSMENGSVHSMPPGPLSSRSAWNLRNPAEELKAFRVLGVIDKVLLVLDSRSQETFILKSLRKSSECSRNRKTIIPYCVPNMVQLKKQIISEDSIFLLLQYAEGGKLWSYVSKFLQKRSEESFESLDLDKHGPKSVHGNFTMGQSSTEGMDSSVGSVGSDLGNMLQGLPLKSNLTSSSQDDSSAPDEDTQDNSHELLGLSSSDSEAVEEECTSSYLTLCHEYEQEKKEPDSLTSETFPTVCENVPRSSSDMQMTSRSHSLLSNDSLCSPATNQELRFFTEDINTQLFSPTEASESLNLSKNSPMEFFRIDSKDSANELVSLDLAEKFQNVKSESAPIFNLVSEVDNNENSFDTSDIKLESVVFLAPDTCSRGSSNDSVPVISFQDAAGGDTSSCEEGRPDLLVNLPGVLEDGEAVGLVLSDKCSVTNTDNSENRLYEKPDVLQINYNVAHCMNSQGALEQVLLEEDGSCEAGVDNTSTQQLQLPENRKEEDSYKQNVSLPVEKEEELNSLFAITHAENMPSFMTVASCSTSDLACIHRILSPIPQIHDRVSPYGTDSGEDSSIYSDHKEASLTIKEKYTNEKDISDEEQTYGEHTDNCDKDSVPHSEDIEQKAVAESHIVTRADGDKLVSHMFKELEESFVQASNAYIPESSIQYWAAEIAAALDALHREGIICHDLNPNNILLNDKGHIQLTYFSRWSEVDDSCDSSAIEKMYCAPEVGGIAEETEACDWWSLGAILFELFTGKSLFQCHPAGINTHTALNLPDHMSEEARSVVQQLLQYNPSERLGAGVSGFEDIKSHPFFCTMDWSRVMS